MSTENQTAPAEAPKLGILPAAPDGRLHPLVGHRFAPCPFCGTMPVMVNEWIGADTKAFMVKCKSRKCPVGPKTTPCDLRGILRGRRGAMQAWNQRPNYAHADQAQGVSPLDVPDRLVTTAHNSPVAPPKPRIGTGPSMYGPLKITRPDRPPQKGEYMQAPKEDES